MDRLPKFDKVDLDVHKGEHVRLLDYGFSELDGEFVVEDVQTVDGKTTLTLRIADYGCGPYQPA